MFWNDEERDEMWAFLKCESGRATVEYAVILSRVVVGCLSAIELVGFRVSSTFGQVSDSLGRTNPAQVSPRGTDAASGHGERGPATAQAVLDPWPYLVGFAVAVLALAGLWAVLPRNETTRYVPTAPARFRRKWLRV